MDTKKLRQKILDLAIRGKLVPQDPNDEPASVLLERIKAEKEQLIKEGKIKRGKQSTSSDTSPYENIPFEIPDSWVWTTVGDISLSILYGVSESAKSAGKYRLLRITDIQNNRVNWDTVPYSDFEDNVQNYILEDGDILFARTGATVGKSYLVNDIPVLSIFASYLIRVKSTKSVLPEYVKLFFESGFYWGQISMTAVGVGQPNVNGTSLANLRIPLPPYNEQTRIVKESINWLNRIDTLDNDMSELEDSVGRIKSKTLDLAIHGKLVPQDPNDEPSIELLRRINPEFQPCDNAHYPFKIPNSWVWAKGKDIFEPMKSVVPSDDTFKYIDIDAIDNKRNIINSPKIISSSSAPSRAIRETIKGDTLFSMVRPYLRNIAMVQDEPCIASSGFFVCRGRKCLIPKICFYIMISNYVVNGLNTYMKGDNSPSINKTHIEKYLFPIPPYAEQQRIVAKIEELFATLDKIKESLEV